MSSNFYKQIKFVATSQSFFMLISTYYVSSYVDLFTSENIKNSSVVHIKCVWKNKRRFRTKSFYFKKQFHCDRGRSLREGKEGRRERNTQKLREHLPTNQFIAHLHSVDRRPRHIDMNKRPMPRENVTRSTALTITIVRPVKKKESATARDREACRAAFPRIPVAGLCPHGALM